MLAPLKLLGLAALIIIAFMFLTGLIAFEKRDYTCLSDWQYGFEEPVEIFRLGSFKINARPFLQTCPMEYQYKTIAEQ